MNDKIIWSDRYRRGQELAASADGSTERMKEAVSEAIREALGGALDCGRVWSAWGVGTMSEDDFSPVADDAERVAEITDAVLAALAARHPVTMTNAGDSEAKFIAEGRGLNCPACGGSGHVDDARPPGAQVPKGWKLVPVKITDEMENAARNQGYYELNGCGDSVFVDGSRDEQWAAMLSAAPPAPPAQGIDLGQLWDPIKEAVHTALSAHMMGISQTKRESVAVYVARLLRDGQRDAAAGGRGE